MAIVLSDNIKVNAPKPVESKYNNILVPYTDTSQANTLIPVGERYRGLTVNINGIEYWYKDGVSNGDLIKKSASGSVTGATNGLFLTNSNSIVALGGILTGNTTFTGGIFQYGSHPDFTGLPNAFVDKQYVDDIASGLRPKPAVLVATTQPITLSGVPQTIDNISVTNGDRVLVKNQASGATNGIYVATGGTWQRALDFDGSPMGEVMSGSYMWVLSGTTNANTAWVLDTPDPIYVGTTPLNFVLFSHVSDVQGYNGLSVSAVTGTHYVGLGGTLSKNTVIQPSSYCFDIGSGVGKVLGINQFCVDLGTQYAGGITQIKGGSNILTLSGGTAIINTFGHSLCYANDVSSYYCDRSLIDKGYLDVRIGEYSGITLTAITGATNGLTKLGQNARLGGTLDNDTYIDTNGNYFSICNNEYGGNPDAEIWMSHGSAGMYSDRNNCTTSFGLQPLGLCLISANSNVGVCNNIQVFSVGDGTSSGIRLNIKDNSQGIIITDSSTTTKHLARYAADYHSYMTDPRMLPDIAYVTGLTASLGTPLTGATNGLGIVGKKVSLGGSLVNNSDITGLFALGFNVGDINLTGTSINLKSNNITLQNSPASGSTTDAFLVWNSVDKKIKQVPQISPNVVNVNDVITNGYVTTAEDSFVGISGATLVCLIASPQRGQKISFADIKGEALASPIFICSGSKTINGYSDTCATINTDYGSITLIYNGYFWSTVAFIN